MIRDFKNISIWDACTAVVEGDLKFNTHKGLIFKWIDTSKTENNTIEMFSDASLYVYGELVNDSVSQLLKFFDDESIRRNDFKLIFIHLEFK